jgi:predicted nuclease of predicted toxin-antitoxin system
VTVRFLADEDLHAGIIDGLRSREPAIDILDVKTVGLRKTPDPVLLDLSTEQDRILITHDRRTMTRHCRERLSRQVAFRRYHCSSEMRDW